MSLNSVATQTVTGGINIEVEHLFKHLKKAQATIQDLESKLEHFRFDEDFFKFNDERVTYFTGLPNLSTLITVFNCIKSEINGNCVLSPFEQIILCIMRLRLPLPVTDLSRIFLETLNILYVRLKFLIHWPDPPDRQNSMPKWFRAKFRTKAAVIIGCFEIFIERPSNLTARHLTWSSYKQHNTIKYLFGITPQGTISFLSESWSGRASDQRITQNSIFLSQLTQGNRLGSVGVRLEIPAFTKGKNKLPA